ncbi:MAG: carbamoyltransferase HypF [Bacteroidales bacterium]|nr:carbamoyltransferase HypF [Bacteroidales bacterium]MCK9498171.1 carbamoyltransferase HypF [Bacteroidales bacterium]MDY0313490.1 carbamoyltransferase HypF [Bacteroidales bacterium]NLB87502.1 carbamoyltransferase HypF [Bacteroidales bacterium]
MLSAKKIQISGLVQGVGFRPFIYKQALKYSLNGWVENRNDGVLIQVEGSAENIEDFIKTIPTSAPTASYIKDIKTNNTERLNFTSFFIKKSENISNKITEISPDIAICTDCLKDLKEQKHRINYPFINCTNCGPRFSIIQDLPYDRAKTTMQKFKMCPICEKEYKDILDRRFHAQPVACNNCGPIYKLETKNFTSENLEEIIDICAELIDSGKIISIKGVGGFFMSCDALNQEAVSNLRKAKARDLKPFAVMCADIETAQEYAEISEDEKISLNSWRRPIVLLKTKKELAKSVCSNMDRTGIILPYMPFHYLLFEKLKSKIIVLTSGNISDNPIIIDDTEAKKFLFPISDALLSYNRDIFNRVDDSVEININKKLRVIRRSRGYVPNPIFLNFNCEGIFAAGAELVNTFCIGKQKQAVMSQHIGDIKNFKTYEFYEESVKRFKQMFRLNIDFAVYDLHPEYFSTKFAKELGVQELAVQHHHAHIASCMAEHGLDEKLIGVAMDGTGLGTDNKIWGGEFFICDYNNFERISHFDYIPIPGGDKATEEPWRTGLSYLYKYFGKDILNQDLDFLKNISEEKINIIISAIDNKLNCPESSSAGRLFDAVSAITNICTISGFHAEAPMRLEASIKSEISEKYDVEIGKIISFKKTLLQIIEDLKNKTSISEISVKFHNTVIFTILETANQIRNKTGLNKIVLSGGSFQNAYLLKNLENILANNKFIVYSHSKLPTNDGGIALGQLAIAAKFRNKTTK